MSTRTLPPLVEGERLDQAEFHARYEAMPPGVRAELIDGVVHMPSPASKKHGRHWGILNTWLGYYEARTPGVELVTAPTTKLGPGDEPEPDAILIIPPERGGQSGDDGEYVSGPPELVAEAARTTRAMDLGAKLGSYGAAGVLEYVVRASDPDEVLWHTRAARGNRLVRRRPDADGIHRSAAFPGLWLDPRAVLAGDMAGVLAAVDRGVATPEHAAFVARLAAARGQV